MKRFILTLALCVFSHSVFAAQLWATPPKKYDHAFRGKVYVFQNLTPLAVGAFWPTYGYTFVVPYTNPPVCVIQVWRRYYNNSLYRHERAHCNGWPWWHPSN